MFRVRSLLASLVVASSLAGCAVPSAEARSTRPDVVAVSPESAPAPIKIMPVAPKVSRQQVRAKLAERRKLTMQRFLAYREARVYPINSSIPGAGHVWLDQFGNFCAAATLIAHDWGLVASANIAQMNNNLALADVTDGEIYNWILTSGMTKAELVSIQVPGWQESRQEWQRQQEVERLYTLYKDVERQIKSLDKHNLELAVDELMKHPQLARDLVSGSIASAGRFAESAEASTAPEAGVPFVPPPPAPSFAQPPT